MNLKDKRILVTGSNGFLGKHLTSLLLNKYGDKNIIKSTKKQHNLLDRKACKKAVKNIDVVVHLAARVGGIGYNKKHPGNLFYENAMMGIQLMEEARKARVKKFVQIGTICSYPKFSPVPFKEENLWDGYPEETNAPYGIAKKAILVQLQAYRNQYEFNGIYLLPVNLYGPGDNFDPNSSHVIPALIKRFIKAKEKKGKEVLVWGTGRATREFLYVEDAAKGILLAAERYNKPEPVNLGAGFEISIKKLAETIKELTGFKGKIVWDKTKPDGQPRRMLDTTRARREFGFIAKASLKKGLKETIDWYKKNRRKCT